MPNLNQDKGFTHTLVVIIIGLGGLLLLLSIIPVSRGYNDGKSAVSGVFLAKGGDEGGSSGESGSDSRDSSGSTDKNSNVENKSFSDKIKSEIRQGNLRIKYEIENGKIKIETKVKEAGNEVELNNEEENNAINEVELELEKDDIKIATAPGQIALVNKKVGALSNFPISIDPTTKQLTVTTPAGTKVVTVLPQKAVDNLLASRVMNEVVSEKVTNSLGSIPDLVNLETKNGVLVYKVKGNRIHILLGFIPIKTGVEAIVSAENGQVMESTDSLLGRILNRLAP